MRPENVLRSTSWQSAVLGLLLLTAAQALPAQSAPSVAKVTYHGWPESYVLSNGAVEAVVAPAVGRVMQFRFVGEEGVFWENGELAGKPADPSAKEWANFGGDKTWPQPQPDWEKIIGRGWPPPPTFDSTPLTASVEGDAVELVSPVDPAYGIRTRRHIELVADQPVLKITTTYEKVSGGPVKVGIGVITQLGDPEEAIMQLPEKTQFPKGYVLLNFDPPAGVRLEKGLLSVKRSQTTRTQIGSDAGTLQWVGKKYVLRIDSPRVEGGEYPNQGSSTVIYTSPDPQAYVELETFSPLSTMKVGDHIQATNTYTLSRRHGMVP
jgi:hypothetical protein